MNEETRIRPRERDTILQALGSGVVPRTGQHHIQVGRSAELGALLRDIERIADGGSAFRLVIGEYGAGKTFFLNLVRSIALEKRLVTAHADLIQIGVFTPPVGKLVRCIRSSQQTSRLDPYRTATGFRI